MTTNGCPCELCNEYPAVVEVSGRLVCLDCLTMEDED